MNRTPLVVGNWKLNTSLAEATALTEGIVNAPVDGVDTVLCPPFPWLVPLAELIEDARVALGAQDCWSEVRGAYTGDVSAALIAPYCRFVIVGHSERRALHGEGNDLVARKVGAVLSAGLIPILCVGESAAQRAAGDAETVIKAQLDAAMDTLNAREISQLVVAYEPVWAIGTGAAATPEDAAAMATLIRHRLSAKHASAARTARVLYGGSVTVDNAADLFATDDIDGALVGGASLDATAFNGIRRAAMT
ncbi:MAG: triose-phosphate isomerase [Chloroflexia bacterium]|nr:triose-phosphate isomerase [Chloroflexia bacterium]